MKGADGRLLGLEEAQSQNGEPAETVWIRERRVAPLVVRVPQVDAGVHNNRVCARLGLKQEGLISRVAGTQGNIK